MGRGGAEVARTPAWGLGRHPAGRAGTQLLCRPALGGPRFTFPGRLSTGFGTRLTRHVEKPPPGLGRLLLLPPEFLHAGTSKCEQSRFLPFITQRWRAVPCSQLFVGTTRGASCTATPGPARRAARCCARAMAHSTGIPSGNPLAAALACPGPRGPGVPQM